jgi:hypothetical protein
MKVTYKALAIMITLIIYVNYTNYFAPDRDKLHRKIVVLENKIKNEKKLNQKKIDKKQLVIDKKDLMFDGKFYSYSKAMGKFQEIITESAKDLCTVKYIKWAQSPVSKNWYEKMKMSVSLVCTPRDFFKFTNKLKTHKKLFYLESTVLVKKSSKKKKAKNLYINLNIVTFRSKN